MKISVQVLEEKQGFLKLKISLEVAPNNGCLGKNACLAVLTKSNGSWKKVSENRFALGVSNNRVVSGIHLSRAHERFVKVVIQDVCGEAIMGELVYPLPEPEIQEPLKASVVPAAKLVTLKDTKQPVPPCVKTRGSRQ